jgi:hypothetical protein
VWIKPEAGQLTIGQYVRPFPGQHFAPVEASDALYWPQTDWPEGVPAYSGVIRSSYQPPIVVTESDVGIQWRVRSQEELLAYIAGNRHLS